MKKRDGKSFVVQNWLFNLF